MNIRRFLGNFAGLLLLQLWFLGYKRNNKKVLSIYFHNPSYKVFNYCTDFLIRHKYSIISIDEFYHNLSNKINLNKSVIISLDDAWQHNLYNVIPIVNKKNIPIAIYVSNQALKDGNLWLKWFRDTKIINSNKDLFPELKNNPKEIKTQSRNIIWDELKRRKKYSREIMTECEVQNISKNINVTIGGHTYTHPILINCEGKELIYEIAESKKDLESLINKTVNYFAYPNGDYNDDIKKICMSSGYKLAFTTEQKMIDLKSIDLFKLPRFCVPNSYLKYESIARMLGLFKL